MPTKDINDAAKPIRDNWEEIKRDFFQAMPGHFLEIDCVHRTPEEQFALFKKGRKEAEKGWVPDPAKKGEIVTNVDGYAVKGAHNYKPSRAVDFRVINNQTGKTTWDDKFYVPLGQIAKRYGLVWGGDWDGDGDRTDQKLMDAPHIELKDYKNYREA